MGQEEIVNILEACKPDKLEAKYIAEKAGVDANAVRRSLKSLVGVFVKAEVIKPIGKTPRRVYWCE
jgi:predicted ArsR family transcriptional regulator